MTAKAEAATFLPMVINELYNIISTDDSRISLALTDSHYNTGCLNSSKTIKTMKL
jgi:hypothetical protein